MKKLYLVFQTSKIADGFTKQLVENTLGVFESGVRKGLVVFYEFKTLNSK